MNKTSGEDFFMPTNFKRFPYSADIRASPVLDNVGYNRVKPVKPTNIVLTNLLRRIPVDVRAIIRKATLVS